MLIPTSEVGSIAAATLPDDLAARFPSSTARPDILRVFAGKALLNEFDVPESQT
ncbi:MAG: hypothetical protein OSA81_07350 [Longimicrobiales bacterium]|nr:hypothetical protein [Longimicrobiales bacterium]